VWREACALQVGGVVRNLADGTVEVVALGTSDQIAKLDGAIRRGPRHARVAKVEKTEISDELTDYKTFDIR
jgi:acylphosphatase